MVYKLVKHLFFKKWRSLAAVLTISASLVGCGGYRPDQRVVGHFTAQTGESLDVRADGRISFMRQGKEEFVGLVTIDNEKPLSIRVIGPDTSPLVGTEIVFSGDRGKAVVDWQDARRGNKRPTDFQRQ